MKCKICSREAQSNGFCSLHLEAYKNIKEKFDVWAKAINVSWEQYLVEIQKNSLTGEWAKEVIKHLIRDENQECHRIK
jgi:hypothetical protein